MVANVLRSAWAGASLRRMASVALVAAAVALSAAIAARSLVRPSARLELSTDRLDLGEGRPGEVLRGELTLRNGGSGPLEFSCIKHCGCTELAPLSGMVAPRASKTLRFGIKLRDDAKSEHSTTVDIHSNDPERPAVQCAVLARCAAPFKVSPRYVDFGSPVEGEVVSAVWELRIESAPGNPPVTIDGLQFKHTNGIFQIALLRDTVYPGSVAGNVQQAASRADGAAGPRSALGSAQAPPRGSVVLRISLNAAAAAGEQYDTLELRLAGSDYPMRVPLYVRLLELASVAPATVVLQRDPASRRLRPVQLIVINRAREAATGAVRLLRAPPGIRLEDLGAIGAGCRRLRLTVEANATWPQRVVSVRFWVQGINKDLEVTLVKPT